MTSEEEELLFNAAIGTAVRKWASVEDVFALIFSLLLIGQPGHQIATLAFSSHTTLRGRLDLTDSVIAVRFKDLPELLKPWSELRSRLSQQSKQRNNIVHSTTLFNGAEKDGRRYALIPSPLTNAIVYTKSNIRSTWYISDIQGIVRNFSSLYSELSEFNKYLLNWPGGIDIFHPSSIAAHDAKAAEQAEKIATATAHLSKPDMKSNVFQVINPIKGK